MSVLPSEARSPSVSIEHDWQHVRWQVAHEWQELLSGEACLPIGQWQDAGRLQIVKQGSHRTVYRIDLAERTLFLKHDRASNFWRALRHLFRPTAARREYRKALELRRRHVPTIEPIAVGQLTRAGVVRDNFLVTAAIPDAVSLTTFVTERLGALPTDMRELWLRLLACRLAELCAACHRAGVYHNDLHGGNILVRANVGGDLADCDPTEAGLELYLVDLPGVQLSGPLNWTRSRQSLVMLESQWRGRVSDRLHWRFWRAYLLARADLQLDRRAAALEIVERCSEYTCSVARRRDKRSLATNGDFYRLATPTCIGHAVADVPRKTLVKWMEECAHGRHDAHLAERDAHVTRIYPKPRSWRDWIARLFRGHPAKRDWRMAHSLLLRGIATPRPLAACLPRGMSQRFRPGYLAIESIPEAVTLQEYLTNPCHRRRDCTTRLGRLIGWMHAWHVSHRGLSGQSVLVQTQPSSVACYLLNLETVRIRRRLSYQARIRELAHLARSLRGLASLTRTDHLRFLRAYVRQLQPESIDVQQLLRDVARKVGEYRP